MADSAHRPWPGPTAHHRRDDRRYLHGWYGRAARPPRDRDVRALCTCPRQLPRLPAPESSALRAARLKRGTCYVAFAQIVSQTFRPAPVYGWVRCSCCFRQPYRVTPRGLYTASTVATSNTISASTASRGGGKSC